MSQITCCPSCGTRFRVVADQLRISQGWVRCGLCQEVFDATENLVPEPHETPAADQSVAQVSAEAKLSPDQPDKVDPQEDSGSDEAAEAAEPRAAAPGMVAQDGEAGVESASATGEAEYVEPGGDPGASPEPAADARAEVLEPEQSVAAEGEEADAAISGGDAAEPGNTEPGFVRVARRKAFWRRPVVRGALVLACLCAVLGLGGQYAWHCRDALAAQNPALQPLLQSMCHALGCELQARKAIADIVISSSGFRQLPGQQGYQWSLSLENRSDVPVATPAVELTLNDEQDRPLLRKVIDLRELGAPVQLEAHGEWSVAVPMQVQGLNGPVAGYRALVFYPN